MLHVLFGDIRLRTTGSDANAARACIPGFAQIFYRADTGQKADGKPSVGEHFGDGGNSLKVSMRAKAVVEAGAC